MYDIKDDKARTRVAKCCKQAGLYRVQYSVFLGTLTASQKDSLELEIQDQIDEEVDSVYIFPNMHDQQLERNKDYLRKKIGAAEKWTDQYLTNDTLRGKVDEVLRLRDDTLAPLDYKFAVYNDRVYDTYRQQLFCYAVLIEENFDRTVERGFLVYIRSKYKLVEVPVTMKDKALIQRSIAEVVSIIEQNKYPTLPTGRQEATKYKRRCLNCTYRNICTQ